MHNKLYDRLSLYNTLLELEPSEGISPELNADYQRSLQLAPDKVHFLEDRIATYSNVAESGSHTLHKKGSKLELGVFRYISFHWVLRGVDASREEIVELFMRNLSVDPIFKTDETAINAFVKEVAKGASYAFHISMLRKELKKQVFLQERNLHDELDRNRQFDQESAKKLPQKVFALKHVFLYLSNEGEGVNNQNKERLAASYGFTSRTSGAALYGDFLKYFDTNSRKELQGSKRKDRPHLLAMQQVIPLLADYPRAFKRAEDEFNILTKQFEEKYL